MGNNKLCLTCQREFDEDASFISVPKQDVEQRFGCKIEIEDEVIGLCSECFESYSKTISIGEEVRQ